MLRERADFFVAAGPVVEAGDGRAVGFGEGVWEAGVGDGLDIARGAGLVGVNLKTNS